MYALMALEGLLGFSFPFYPFYPYNKQYHNGYSVLTSAYLL